MSSNRGPAFLVVVTAAALLAVGRSGAAASETGLVDAARARDGAAVASLIKQQVDVNATAPDGATALHWAAHWNDLDMADVLIRAGARVNAANQFGVTPLWLASENGSAAMIEELLRVGADPNAALRSGETPLMAAARTGREPAVRALLEAGAGVDAREFTHGQTALMWAAAENHVDVVRLLVAHDAGVSEASKAGFTPLMFVARRGNVQAATLLLAEGADVNAVSTDGSTPLLVAAVRGHVDLALALLARGANPNMDKAGYTPLHWASGVWEAPITFDYELRGEWAAIRGVPTREGKLRLIRALIAHGADLNAQLTKTPPRNASSIFPDHELVGATPFFLAAVAADAEVMRLLLAAGADPTLPTKDENVPLIAAAGGFLRVDYETSIPEAQVLDAMRWLLEIGSDINATNARGMTALHAAALGGLDTVVEYLVPQGASLTAETNDGKTPLEMAVRTELTMQIIVRLSTAALLRKLGGQ